MTKVKNRAPFLVFRRLYASKEVTNNEQRRGD